MSDEVCDRPTRIVYILRGPPGAGKTTFQKNEFPKAWVCSADDYFNRGCRYEFDPRKLPEAHTHCMGVFLEGFRQKAPAIVVDNTNTMEWEWINYKRIAELMGYDVRVIEFVPHTIEQLRTIAARNVHYVPQSIIADMAVRFQPYKDADEASVE